MIDQSIEGRKEESREVYGWYGIVDEMQYYEWG